MGLGPMAETANSEAQMKRSCLDGEVLGGRQDCATARALM
jgi:hypothetical protein